MRVLHVLDHSLPVQSGYAFRSAAILREQRRLGVRTIHVTGTKQGCALAPLENVDGLDFHRTLASGSYLERAPVVSQIEVVRSLRARVRELIASEQPDIIHAHSPCLNGLAALGLGKPVVYELRSSWEDAAVSSGTTSEGSVRYRASRWLETVVLRGADAVTTICSGLRDEVVRRGIASERVTVVPNAVDLDQFVSLAPDPSARRELGLEGSCVLGFIGSFFAWEGLGKLIEALPAVLAQRSDVRVLLVGGGSDEPALRSTIARLGLDRHVIFAGHVAHGEVLRFYGAIDVLVYPRLPLRLTEMVTPLKPLEAMALGKVLIASDVGGHRELIRHGETGMLFRAGDADALARCVLEVMADSALRQRLSERGPRFVREERTWPAVVRRYRPVYESLLLDAAA